ncbi:hypothetical protein [Bartonella sp. MU70NMGDW]|uniref:hypothetical protein n=1 Tax=Bartonella sp. MU70NMGDW TaxID=3243561 RepID=UPI0035D0CB86
MLIIFLLTYLLSTSHRYTGMDTLFCSKVFKERDDAIQKLDSEKFEKENAERRWNDTMKILAVGKYWRWENIGGGGRGLEENSF